MWMTGVPPSADGMANSLIIADGEGREISVNSLHEFLPKTLRDR
jgi:hypothetical protein